ncbi:MAG TPA: M48 family metalloprotease [Gammaproteobacteria bacterium]|nr:M48 family metalloprotease [Gammaproteobacteria bacterium]
MDFFERQDEARRQTRVLVLLFLLATAVIVAAVGLVVAIVTAGFGATGAGVIDGAWVRGHAGLLALSMLGTLAFIALASGYRTLRLSAGGGGSVARQLGGSPVLADAADPLRARLRNVVEEMAIASGIAVPDVYLLEAERGINAFAAGYSPNDAAIAVTRGALEQLSRDELQGVVAHEFSHVLNGDMRLNTRLMGLLFGILAISFVGRTVLRAGGRGGLRMSRSRRGGGGGTAMLFAAGLALLVIGYIGVFFGRLIKAGASRERERLADASAVQFTRQTEGLAGALKKIGGLEAGAALEAADREEVSHMLFAMGLPSLAGWLATHPPLIERIRALEPGFDSRDLERLRAEAAAPDEPARDGGPGPAGALGLVPAAVAASTGLPEARHVDYARQLRASIPDALYQAAHASDGAALLVLALILHPEGAARQRQLEHVDAQFGRARRDRVEALGAEATALGEAGRLPLLDLALPALRRRPAAELEFLVSRLRTLVELDGHLELHEFALVRVLEAQLDARRWPGRARPRRPAKRELREAVATVFAVLARHGHPGEDAARAAWTRGLAVLFGPERAAAARMPDTPADAAILDRALEALRGLDGPHKRRLVEALSATVAHDRTVSVGETELLRAICATLDSPLPPLLAG